MRRCAHTRLSKHLSARAAGAFLKPSTWRYLLAERRRSRALRRRSDREVKAVWKWQRREARRHYNGCAASTCGRLKPVDPLLEHHRPTRVCLRIELLAEALDVGAVLLDVGAVLSDVGAVLSDRELQHINLR